jgi:hypothetical protein
VTVEASRIVEALCIEEERTCHWPMNTPRLWASKIP